MFASHSAPSQQCLIRKVLKVRMLLLILPAKIRDEVLRTYFLKAENMGEDLLFSFPFFKSDLTNVL